MHDLILNLDNEMGVLMKKLLFAFLLFLALAMLYGCGQSAEVVVPDTNSAAAEVTAVEEKEPTAADTVEPTLTCTPSPSVTPTPEPLCIPGETVFDEEGEVDIAHADLIKVESWLEGEELTVVFTLRGIPREIEFNREGVETWVAEYSWAAFIDSDSDPSTGDPYHEGADYALFTVVVKEGKKKTADFLSVFYESFGVKRLESNGSVYNYSSGVLAVDYENGTLTMTGRIPGITADSSLVYEAFDINPEGDPVWDSICE